MARKKSHKKWGWQANCTIRFIMSIETTEDIRSNVYEILKDFSTAMVVTVTSQGGLKSRPFHLASVEEIGGEVWFLTGRDAHLVQEVEENPEVLLVFQNENSAYLSIRGEAHVVQDRAKVRELWKKPYQVWFPGGAEDPEIVLIGVNLTGAEYWDQRGLNRLEYLFQATKAYVKGEKPHLAGEEQHAKTSL
jgi:general stress protein 26